MVCKSCGRDVSDGAKICSECGEFVDVPFDDLIEDQLELDFGGVDDGGAAAEKKKAGFSFHKKIRYTKRFRNFLFSVSGITLAIVLLSVGVASLFPGRATSAEQVIFIKHNKLFMSVKGKTAALSEGVISNFSVDAAEGINYDDVLSQKKLVVPAPNRQYVYFFSDFDITKNSGELFRADAEGKVTKVAADVNNSILLSENGGSVLYLAGADFEGVGGVLFAWDGNKSTRINPDMDEGNFYITPDGKSALFLQNYNRAENRGDLFMRRFGDDDKIRLESEVYKIIGSNKSGGVIVFAKSWSGDTYDLYMKTADGESLRIAENVGKTPVLPDANGNMLVYSAKESNFKSALSVKNVNNGNNYKVDGYVTEAHRYSTDTIVFYRMYEEGQADFYVSDFLGDTERIEQNILTNRKHLSLSENLNFAAYISDFDVAKNHGNLALAQISGGKIVGRAPIDVDVFSCKLSADGKELFYVKNYSANKGIGALYCYSGGKSAVVAEEVDPNLLSFTPDGKCAVFLTKYNATQGFGDLNAAYSNGRRKLIAHDVCAFYPDAHNRVFFLKDFLRADESYDLLLCALDSDSPKKLEEGVSRIIECY